MEIFQVTILQHRLFTCFFATLLVTKLMTAAIAVAETTTVKVSTTPIFPEIPLGQARKDFQVLLRVEAPAAAARPEAHVPVDVVAVLGVSGSMNDLAAVPPPEGRTRTTTRLDLLKAAAKFMVSKLQDGDRLSIVPFNDRPVKVLGSDLLYMTTEGRRNAMRSVDMLEARGGGTAIVPALEEAVKALDGRVGDDGRNRLGFIILVTDGGDDTTRITRSERRREVLHVGHLIGRYPVHTFGLGRAHDPEALLYLAQESHGTYSFIDDDDIGVLTGALAVCLGGLSTVAAVETRVVLTADEPNGVRIHRVDSGGHDSSVSCGGTSCDVSVGVLYAGEAKHFVVHLDVPAAASMDGGHYCDGVGACDRDSDRYHHRHRHEQYHLLAVGYSYGDHPGARVVTVDGDGVFMRRPPAAVLDGGRPQAPVAVPSPVVLQHIVRFDLLEVVLGIIDGELVTAGDRAARAAAAASVLQLRWEEFRACHQFWGGGGMDDLLSGLEKEVDSMVTSLKAGVAAYVYAWVSSHQTQRATAVGSPEKAVGEFLTPAMLLLLEEARQLPPPWQLAGTPENVVNVQHAGGGCGVDSFEMVDRRLELWSKVKRDVQHLVSFQLRQQAAVDEEEQHLAAVFQEASLEAIDRAMHRDIYLAAVYASKQRRCRLSASNEK